MVHNPIAGITFWRIDVRKDYEIVGSYNNQRYSVMDCERTVNLFEYIDSQDKKQKTLIPTSGLTLQSFDFGTETGGCRAAFVFKDSAYFVFGASLFKLTGSVMTKIGNLVTTTGYVAFDANTYQVILVDGVKGYLWNTVTSSFSQITSTSFPNAPLDVCALDGFFVVINGGTNQFYLSSLNNGNVWTGGLSDTGQVVTGDVTPGPFDNTLIMTDTSNYQTGVPFTLTNSGGALPTPLNTTDTYYAIQVDATHIRVATTQQNAFSDIYITLGSTGTGTSTAIVTGQLQVGAVNSHPGTLVACITLHRRLFLFSQNFTEVWENAGIGFNLPFRRNNSLLMEVGTPSIGSVVVGFDMMFFLSQDRDGLGAVMKVVGTQAIPVSNRALDYQLAQYASDSSVGVSGARGILIKENGLIFYRLNFTAANHTYVYNDSMSSPEQPRWHEEEILNGDRHPAQAHVYYLGKNYYGDYLTSKIYLVDPNNSTNNDESIRRMRIGSPQGDPEYNRIRVDRWQLDLLQGNVDMVINDLSVLSTEDSSFITTENGDEIILDQQSISPGGPPTVFLSISKDGGQTYGNRMAANMGNVGERAFRTVWRKLGVTPRGQYFIPKVEFYNEVPFVMLGASWDFEVLPE